MQVKYPENKENVFRLKLVKTTLQYVGMPSLKIYWYTAAIPILPRQYNGIALCCYYTVLLTLLFNTSITGSGGAIVESD